MATQRNVVETIVKGTDQASAVFDRVSGKLGGFTTLAGVSAVGVTTAVAGATVAIGALAVNTARDIDAGGRVIQRALGDNADAAINYRDVMESTFSLGIGANFVEIGQVIGEVGQNTQRLGGVSEQVLARMTRDAFRVRDAFGDSTNESLSAATTLMEQFGLSGQQAFDFIVAGNQRGLNASGDLLDTINEYSVQFRNAGADAGDFFSLLETGVGGGTFLGTDRVADLFKEFRTRITDGTDLTRQSLNALGIDADSILANIADSNITVADAFEQVISRIKETDDPLQAMQAGVGLLGTQFEDLGDEAVRNLSLATTGVDDLAGSADSLNASFDTTGEVLERFGRRFLLALVPAGDAILDLVSQNLPALENLVDTIARRVGALAEGFANITIDFAVGVDEGGLAGGIANAIAQGIGRTDFGQTQIGGQVAGAVGAAIYAATAEDPPWLSLLLTYVWPAVPTAIQILTGQWEWPSPPDLIARLTDWEWPTPGAYLADWLGWTWPSAPAAIDNLINYAWPAVPGVISGLIAWQWPAAPAWIDRLLNFNFSDLLPSPLGAGGISPPVTGGITPQGLPLLAAGPPQILPVMAEVVSLLFGGGGDQAVIDATANITQVDTANLPTPEPLSLPATVDTEPDWGEWAYNYDVMATVNTEPDFGTFDHVYAVAAEVDRNPRWGSWNHTYPANARVTGVDFRENFFTTTYRATARVTQFVTQVVSSVGNALFPSNASGTDFFEGGLTYVHQGEVLMAAPRGTRVIPADRVNTLLRGGNGGGDMNVNIYLTASGNQERDARAVRDGVLRAARALGRR